MKLEKIELGHKRVMPFTIPSGIVMTEVACAEKLLREIPELGIWTTKSIGPKPRTVPERDEVNNRIPGKEYGNREPILAQYYPGCFVNAVGLTNPGAEEFAKKMRKAEIPYDKFVLASIFGKNAEEFVFVAKTLENLVDGFELNLSCPHTTGYGMQLGQDPKIVKEITKAVTGITKKPVFAKLTPNAGNIGEIAQSAVAAGAYGISAINTVGPGYHSVDGFPVLTNKVGGGLSGTGIIPIGLRCVRDIRQAVGKNVPMIVMGGIRTVRDVEAYGEVAGHDNVVYGIGSAALAGMDDKTMKGYLAALVDDIRSNGWTNNASIFLRKVDMDYRKVTIEDKLEAACDIRIFRTDESMQATPGQFVFAWIPGIGEKPFSVMDDDPLTLGILERGEFTRQINTLKEGDSFYVRGPYGQGVDIPKGSNVVLVGGGCGIAGLYLLAKTLFKKVNLQTFLGAKDKQHLFHLRELEKYGQVFPITENGDSGRKGLVSDLFGSVKASRGSYFFNCGPKAMVDAVLPLELEVSSPKKVYSSIDYMTRCGVGVCGSCADEKGRRTCIEGPFMTAG